MPTALEDNPPTALSAYDARALLERQQPAPEDLDFLTLKDIGGFVRKAGQHCSGRLLDFGCGRSPYRIFWPNCNYLRADLAGAAGVDYVVGGDGRVDAADREFDVVLSTQVAEHVADPAVYFGEAFRVLRPGGRLILTTHGIWEDHAVPEDYQRWTADGLTRDLRLAGFTGINVTRLTAESRALCQLVSRHFSTRLDGPGFSRGVRRKLWRHARPLAHYWMDRWTSRWGATQEPVKLYLGIAIAAKRPE